MTSWNDAKEFYDPETASSCGFSHVPSQPLSIPSLRGLITRDFCLQPDTRNSFGTSGNVFEDLLAPSEHPSAFYGNSRSTAPTPCDPVSLNTGRLAERASESERAPQNFQIPTPIFARKFFNLESSQSCTRSLSAKLHG